LNVPTWKPPEPIERLPFSLTLIYALRLASLFSSPPILKAQNLTDASPPTLSVPVAPLSPAIHAGRSAFVAESVPPEMV
jgi:hypothetical protein